MIEAVNSVLSNASVTRVAAEQQSTSRSPAANPARVQEAATKAPYVSPYISIDRASNRAVLQIRDSDTGDVVRQFPTEGQLKAYQSAQRVTEQAQSQGQQSVPRDNALEGQRAPSPVDINVSTPAQVVQTAAPSVETEA